MSTPPDGTPQATSEAPDKGVGCDALFGDSAMLDWLDKNMDDFFNSRYHVIAKFDGLRAGLQLAMQPDIDEGGDPGVHDAEDAANSAHCDDILATDANEAKRL